MIGFRVFSHGGTWNVYNCNIYGREDAIGALSLAQASNTFHLMTGNIVDSNLYSPLYAIDFYGMGSSGGGSADTIGQFFLNISNCVLSAEYPQGGLGSRFDQSPQVYPVCAVRISAFNRKCNYSISVRNSTLSATDKNNGANANDRVIAGIYHQANRATNLSIMNSHVLGLSNGRPNSKGYGLRIDDGGDVQYLYKIVVGAEASTFDGDTFDLSNANNEAVVPLNSCTYDSYEGNVYNRTGL